MKLKDNLVVGLLFSLALVIAFAAWANEEGDYLGPKAKVVENLFKLGQLARERKLPILLIATQDYCSHCDLLKEEIIQPMLISGDYEDRVIIREILLDSEERIPDFSGTLRRQADIADEYNVWVTPTLLYIDGNGKQVAETMLGVNSLDYYGYYVDESIAKGLEVIRQQ